MSQLDATLAALADPYRRGVVDLLRREPRRAGDLADELGVSRPAMSRHLKVLRRTGLIEPASDDADARARIYRLLPEPFSALRRWLDDVEQFWRHELDAFRRHAEAIHLGTSAATSSAVVSRDLSEGGPSPGEDAPARRVGTADRIAKPVSELRRRDGAADRPGDRAGREAGARSSVRRTRPPTPARSGKVELTARAAPPARRGGRR